MLLYLDFLRPEDASDGSSFISDEGGAEYAHGNPAAHFLLPEYAQDVDQDLLCVAYEGEGEVVLLNELLMALGILCAYANHHIAQ